MTDDVIVVGGGVIGCIVARTLASERDVRVIEGTGIASGATGRAAGLIAPTLFYADKPDAARLANEFFREFDGTGQFRFTERQRLDFAAPEKAEEFRRRAEDLSARGFPVEYLDAEAVEDQFSVSMGDFAGAVHYDDTGWVDPYTYAQSLGSDAEARGATIEMGTNVKGLVVEDGAVAGVQTDDGVREASTVVVAAGWRTPSVVDPHVSIPVRPYRTQCVVLDPGSPLDDSFPMGRIGSESLYFRPEHNGDLLVGGGHSTPDDPESASTQHDEWLLEHVATVVPELLVDLRDAGFVDGWAGLDGATPDGRPIVDTVGPDGLVVATGFNGLGVMASPLAAARVESLVDGDSSIDLPWLGLGRFESTDSGFDLQTTSQF